ncbi:MAG: S9 family peptidase [Bernardetiaceae bacterium]|nr:S9 family peptidase [Bernardetiaceae bacterium]
MKKLLLITGLWGLGLPLAAQKVVPTFEQVISLRGPGTPVLSPDGQLVAYPVTTTDWKDNTFDTEIWLARPGQPPFPCTNTPKGNSSSPRFSPDGRWLAFLADRGGKTQIFALRTDGGEALPQTAETEGINSFEWLPDGSGFIFAQNEKESKPEKTVKERYGAWAEEDTEFRLTHLWRIDFKPDLPNPAELPCYAETDSAKQKECLQLPKAQRLTQGNFTVSGFAVAPVGGKVAVVHQPNPLINSFFRSDISVLDLATQKLTPLVTNRANDSNPVWAPDGQALVYSTSLDDTLSNYYRNNQIYRVGLGGGPATRLAADFDEQISLVAWRPGGLYFVANQKTNSHLFRIDPASGRWQRVSAPAQMVSGASFSRDGGTVALLARTATTLPEVMKTALSAWQPQTVTQFNDQIANWQVAQSELISWKSQDGATIEGVLHKPANYDPQKKYPLLVIIHGGPTGIDSPTPVTGYVYPLVQWLAKGALVLRPNYRGSAGYGEAFRALNVGNLGIGDAWDVLSGVDHLDKLGLVDTTRLGCMGWSQGGYISAFLATNSRRFKAISVGAGISNWVTYYANTDIHPFTRQYLKNTPWADPEIYARTSPMTNIRQAATPTLIQHGELDRRVPLPNAYELYQGLQDEGVPTKLFIYKGFGHGITKPKERLAATWHNWAWFNQYLWGETVALPGAK